jgi:hypothetical protein
MGRMLELISAAILRREHWVALITGVIVAAGCSSKTDQAPGQASDTATATSEAAPPIVPAPAVTQASWAPDALEELLAPIALYPDHLLGQVLAASVNSQEVLDGGNWLLQNENLNGEELDAAAEKAGLGPAMRALVHFPTVIDMMCQEIDWTRQVGSAFSSDQKSVLDAIQRLRAQAAEVGNLKSTPEQTVETRTENDKVIVEVKPADPQVVYVPTYDPQAVYTTPQATTTTTTTESYVSTGTAVATGLFAFGVGVLIGNAMDDDDYCYPHWGYGAVYVGPRPFYPPAYVYRPAYGPAFHPAYRYAPPAGYRHNYNSINVNRNIAVNNSDYYNRFNGNQNLHGGATRSPLATTKEAGATRQAGTQGRPGQASAANRAESWKGQPSYAGAREPGTGERSKQTAGQGSGDRQPGGAAGTRESRDLPASHGAHVDRGYGESTRTANREPTRAASHDATRTASHEPARPPPAVAPPEWSQQTSFDRPTETSTRTSLPNRDDAFSGASRQGSGSFDRASSARGHASAGSHSQRAARSGGRRR